MSRTNVYAYGEDGTKTLAGWFDPDKADLIKEDRRWDGHNMVSVHTTERYGHQTLYRTSGGRWVLNFSSQWQGSEDRYEFVTDERARAWLLVNGSDDVIAHFFGEVEEERGPGRPEVGPAFSVRFPPELLDRVDQAATVEGISRAEMIRRLVVAGLT